MNGIRREIAGPYVLPGDRQVGFEVATYDAGQPLIIDPVLIYSTYLGDSGDDHGRGIAVDASGNAYVTGRADSSNFTTASAFQAAFGGGSDDVFVAKLNAAGSALVYSTYLGGNSTDIGNDIAIDGSGNAYLTGNTNSTNFPTASPFQAAKGGGTDAFVTKLNAAGSALVYSTYLVANGTDMGNDIAIDGSGNGAIPIRPAFPRPVPFRPLRAAAATPL